MKTVDLSGKPFHFIGIGGIGMSALAYVLAKRNLPVSGSDIRSTHITARLESVGAKIFSSQQAQNLQIFTLPKNDLMGNPQDSMEKTFPQIICSTAINHHNAEYKEAVNQGYPIFHRSDLLAALIKDYHSVAIAGTHGKTTTSSMIGYVLLQANLDPTIIVGGEVTAWEGNARLGNSQFLVAEADESDGSLAKHSPNIGVITNIELDHPDHYENIEQVIKTFQVFADQSEILIGCLDCPIIAKEIKLDISYSIKPESNADYTVTNILHHADGTQADVWEKGQFLGQLTLLLSGNHNLSNALASVAVGRKLGLDFSVIALAIAKFEGAKRRFENKGNYNGITLIDDYAHHPSEIRCTLEAARLRLDNYQGKRIVAIFQPHRYTRTSTFLAEFATCFESADIVILTEIYSAGEKNITGITGKMVASAIRKNHNEVYYHASISTLKDYLTKILIPGDLTLFLGAGNLNKIIPDLLKNADTIKQVA